MKDDEYTGILELREKISNLPEWDFSYPVTKDLELVAQWMPKMPISTEPITYMDKDGKQQVCNEYTVLMSNSFLESSCTGWKRADDRKGHSNGCIES